MTLTKEDFEKAKEAMRFYKIDRSVIWVIINSEGEILQDQKLRELVELYPNHPDSNISSFCKQLLEESKK